MNYLVRTIVLASAVFSAGVRADELAAGTYADYVSEAGEIRLPEGYRQRWSHLGSWIVADQKAPGHGFHDV